MVGVIKKIATVVLSLWLLFGGVFTAYVIADPSDLNHPVEGGDSTTHDSSNRGGSLNDLQNLSSRFGNMVEYLATTLGSESARVIVSSPRRDEAEREKIPEIDFSNRGEESGFNVEQEKKFLRRLKKCWNVHKGERHESIRK